MLFCHSDGVLLQFGALALLDRHRDFHAFLFGFPKRLVAGGLLLAQKFLFAKAAAPFHLAADKAVKDEYRQYGRQADKNQNYRQAGLARLKDGRVFRLKFGAAVKGNVYDGDLVALGAVVADGALNVVCPLLQLLLGNRRVVADNSALVVEDRIVVLVVFFCPNAVDVDGNRDLSVAGAFLAVDLVCVERVVLRNAGFGLLSDYV